MEILLGFEMSRALLARRSVCWLNRSMALDGLNRNFHCIGRKGRTFLSRCFEMGLGYCLEGNRRGCRRVLLEICAFFKGVFGFLKMEWIEDFMMAGMCWR
jgi:hypothetical protein